MRCSLLLSSLPLLVSLLACAGGDAADTAGIDNSSIDDWCDGGPCGWQRTEQSITRVATWHKLDYGVSFDEIGSQISQVTNDTRHRCFTFDTIADVAPEAGLVIEIDFNDDGLIEHSQAVTAVGWRSAPFRLNTPVAYESMRVTVRKEGTGRAVLGLLRVLPESPCSGKPFTLENGSRCSLDAVCESGHCVSNSCQP